jgi:5-methyltetrahydropteroyltriglutamate--homocysteine methyltransferase
MTARTTPPFRADHVGSFLRPKYLLDARAAGRAGDITASSCARSRTRRSPRSSSSSATSACKSITDGEFRRTYFHIDFLEQLGGVKTDLPQIVRKPDGTEELAPPGDARGRQGAPRQGHPEGRLRVPQRPGAEASRPGCTPKVTIPSPDHAALSRRARGISREAYPELDPDFYDDVAKAYGDELRSLHAAGCRYVQMDDTNMAYLCDEKMREAARQRGDDPNELPHRYARFINKVVAQKPEGMTLAMHLCRGNFKSTFAAQGNYEPVAEALLAEMHLDAYFMEYDDDRSGDFRPLRYLPKGKTVVLGLVTTKFDQLEKKDDLKRRIDEASRYAPLEQLALSPQCGFSSTVHGNKIHVEVQRQKLALVVETAREVWG